MILVVAATARELEHVQGTETLVCGIGPVESALATAARLASGERPGALLQIGIAGAQRLAPPAVVLGSEAVYSDVLDPSSVLARVDRVSPDAGLLERARAVLPDAHVLPIATTGKVGGGSCEVEAMEGFGVLRAAALAGVPALEVRAISNLVGERDRQRWQIAEALAALAGAITPLLEALDA